MGYETTLLIGRSGTTIDEMEKGELVFEDGELYRPYLKNDKGHFITTGRKETYFSVYATIDLCKCGHASAMSGLDRKNTDENHFWMWYEGSEGRSEDTYGDRPKPVKINEVIAALEDDLKVDFYRRFDWALKLLKSMESDQDEISVMLLGH